MTAPQLVACLTLFLALFTAFVIFLTPAQSDVFVLDTRPVPADELLQLNPTR